MSSCSSTFPCVLARSSSCSSSVYIDLSWWITDGNGRATLLFEQTNSLVKLGAIRLKTLSLPLAPKTIKLFVNNVTMGFDDAESLEPAQEIVLTEAQAKGDEAIPLRFVRFQNVSALSVSHFGSPLVSRAVSGIGLTRRLCRIDLCGEQSGRRRCDAD